MASDNNSTSNRQYSPEEFDRLFLKAARKDGYETKLDWMHHIGMTSEKYDYLRMNPTKMELSIGMKLWAARQMECHSNDLANSKAYLAEWSTSEDKQ